MCRVLVDSCVLLACCLLGVLGGEDVADTKTLRLVHVVFRHGDRNPADPTFKTDTENQEWTWPGGWGQLTTVGMRRHFKLGKYLQKRYAGFVSKTYNASEIYVRSTDVNRTLQSAAANMAGFYSGGVDNNTGIVPGLAWLPVPVHTVEAVDDRILRTMPPNPPCPKVDYIRKLVHEGSEWKKFKEDHKHLMKYLEDKTGEQIEYENDFHKIWDVLNCEKAHSDTHKWPAWVNDTFFEQLTPIVQDAQNRFIFNSEAWLQLRGGPLLNEITNRMGEYVRKGPNDTAALKYYVYSAHDITLMPLLITLGAYNGLLPPYASAVLLELHQETTGAFTVQLYYHNTSATHNMTESAHRLAIGDCPQPCLFDDFVKRSNRYFVSDWNRTCGNDDYAVNSLYLAIVLVLIVLLFIMLLLYCKKTRAFSKLKEERAGYGAIPQDDDEFRSGP